MKRTDESLYPTETLSEALTFDDVLLVPRYSEITPPDADLKTMLTPTISLGVPFISAAMDKVTESRTEMTMAQAGGVGVIHRNFSVEKQAFEVEKVKKSQSGMIIDPRTLQPEQTVSEALLHMKKYGISGLPIIESGKLVGIITNRDLRFEETLTRPIKEVMTRFEKLVTARVGVPRDRARPPSLEPCGFGWEPPSEPVKRHSFVSKRCTRPASISSSSIRPTGIPRM